MSFNRIMRSFERIVMIIQSFSDKTELEQHYDVARLKIRINAH